MLIFFYDIRINSQSLNTRPIFGYGNLEIRTRKFRMIADVLPLYILRLHLGSCSPR